MARLYLALLAIVLSCIGIAVVSACGKKAVGSFYQEIENTMKTISFLVKRYQALLEDQAESLSDPRQSATAKRLIPRVTSQLSGYNKVIDKTIFNKFRGSCVPPGKREPTELCGSAKSIACYAPWGHRQGVLDSVHAAVVRTVRQVYGNQESAIREAMIEGFASYCPRKCRDWVQPFQYIMLVWEQREHPRQYKVTPNCLPLGRGGI
ncbi:hypothetical protein BGZ98_001153 [Dissophora globulifera]|nr:hypothetical protein BGZ98_001153 [Dissophora globulifera]